MDALERARVDLDAGRAWQARDRLTSFLVHRQDDEVLELLAGLHLAMGDQLKAGALLYVVRRGQAVDEAEQAAVAAWRQRFGDAAARWRSIPAPVRSARAVELDALRVEAAGRGPDRDLPLPDSMVRPRRSSEALGCLVLAVALATLAVLVVVGALTVFRWVF